MAALEQSLDVPAVTGTKVKIDHYSHLVDGVSLSTLGDLGFAYMKRQRCCSTSRRTPTIARR